MTDSTTPLPPPAPRLTIEAWANQKATAAWLFAGAKAGERWAVGAELTEAAYDDAVERAGNVQVR